MPEFKTFKELEKYLKEKVIPDVLMNETASEIKETERRYIQKDVYDVYKPKMYKRRKDGGLMDEKNIVGAMISDDTLQITNETPANPYGIPQEQVTTDKDLAMLIEYGDGGAGGNNFYDFPSEDDSSYMNPRPFTANTIEELKNSKAHVKAFKEGLKRNGIETE